jgi:hypothetical protein
VYLQNQDDPEDEIFTTDTLVIPLNIHQDSWSKSSHKNIYSKNFKMTKFRNLIFHKLYLRKYKTPKVEILTTSTLILLLNIPQGISSETSQEKKKKKL